MDDILFYEDINQYNMENDQVDQVDSMDVYEVEEEISENELYEDKSDFFVSGDNVIDGFNCSEVVSVDSLIPKGSVINNYYSVYVSGNEVSENILSSNIMDKPLSEYSIQESLTFFSIVLALGVGLIIFINKGVFRWN